MILIMMIIIQIVIMKMITVIMIIMIIGSRRARCCRWRPRSWPPACRRAAPCRRK